MTAPMLTDDDPELAAAIAEVLRDPAMLAPAPAAAPPRPQPNIEQLGVLGSTMMQKFASYEAERVIIEQKWLRNLRQYLGIYDPEIDSQLGKGRSRAYPRITRVKCISVLSRIMNLMFPGNERNWQLTASPNAEMAPEDVMAAVEKFALAEGATLDQLDDDRVQRAVQRLADERAQGLSRLIDDQLQEIGGDQTQDFVSMNRQVALSGILYGVGLVRGPFARTVTRTVWQVDAAGQPAPTEEEQYKPMLEFLPVWDFYPDMSAKTLRQGDGYFTRLVMSRAQVRALQSRPDFLATQIQRFLATNEYGNYKQRNYETQLRNLGAAANVSDNKPDQSKYEVIVWYGTVRGALLDDAAGLGLSEEQREDDIEAEVWLIGDTVIKADRSAWAKLGAPGLPTVHAFLFDEDDTSPVGNGLPNVVRDSQMAICAATRMLLDNASVVCGPNLELNTALLRADQDLVSVQAYKNWYRDDEGASAQWPAIRKIDIDGHLPELQSIVKMFLDFADTETFVGPATGGDMAQGPSEPRRTAVGASMLQSDAALPFKDVVRNHDKFTQSVLHALARFNQLLNPTLPAGDYNVIPRGATSLIAKEVRGMQVDQLAMTLTPEDRLYIDERKFMEARFAVRDLDNLLVPEDVVAQRKAEAAETAKVMTDLQQEQMRAEIRDTLTNAMKNIAQAQKNSAGADAATVKAGLDVVAAGTPEPAAAPAAKKPAAKKPAAKKPRT